ncbi:MAG: hypothetical protein AAGC56_02540 [Pseudomonadota bacterium]
MANANTDPSMEEILASIRRIIAEDDEDAPGAPVAPGDEDADGPAMSAVPPGAGGQVGASEDAGGVFDAVTAAAGVAVEERVASAFDTLAADVARRDVAGDAGASDARTARAAPENSTAYGVESRHQTRQSDQSVASDETGTIVAGQFADVGATKEPSMISDTSAAAATKAFQRSARMSARPPPTRGP